jgi:Rubredoxin
MAKYRCQLCGHIYDEEKEGIKFEELPDDWKCPMCFAPKSMFKLVEEDNNKQETAEQEETKQEGSKSIELKNYLKEYKRDSDEKEKIC